MGRGPDLNEFRDKEAAQYKEVFGFFATLGKNKQPVFPKTNQRLLYTCNMKVLTESEGISGSKGSMHVNISLPITHSIFCEVVAL